MPARTWRPATRTAGLDGLRIHDLRHTAVPCGSRPAPDRKEVAARAGHTSVSFTLDRYGHLYPESDTTLCDRLDAPYSAGQCDQGRCRRAVAGALTAPARPRNTVSAAGWTLATL